MTDEPRKPPLHRQIDESLKRVYEELLKDDVPDRFKKLLDELRSKQPKG